MSDTKEKEVFHSRKFLNPRSAGGLAAIEATVTLHEGDDSISVSAHLSLSDCSRKVTLEFDAYDYGTNLKENLTLLRERRRKAQLLQETIEGYCAALEAAYTEMEEKLPAKIEVAKKEAVKRKQKRDVVRL